VGSLQRKGQKEEKGSHESRCSLKYRSKSESVDKNDRGDAGRKIKVVGHLTKINGCDLKPARRTRGGNFRDMLKCYLRGKKMEKET